MLFGIKEFEFRFGVVYFLLINFICLFIVFILVISFDEVLFEGLFFKIFNYFCNI